MKDTTKLREHKTDGSPCFCNPVKIKYTDSKVLNAIIDYKNVLISIGKLAEICKVSIFEARAFIKQADIKQ